MIVMIMMTSMILMMMITDYSQMSNEWCLHKRVIQNKQTCLYIVVKMLCQCYTIYEACISVISHSFTIITEVFT